MEKGILTDTAYSLKYEYGLFNMNTCLGRVSKHQTKNGDFIKCSSSDVGFPGVNTIQYRLHSGNLLMK